jgi:glycosyltransferase involved in cell wall biosynthesis
VASENMVNLKICFLSYTHIYNDTRILHKEAFSLAEAGFEVVHLAPDHTAMTYQIDGVNVETYPRCSGILGRLVRFVRLFKKGVQMDADCYHCNEIESWFVGLLIKLFHRDKRVIFDVHEHYPSRFDEPHVPKGLGLIGKPAIQLCFQILPMWTDYLIFAKRSVEPDFRLIPGRHDFIFNYGPLRLLSHTIEDVDPSIRQEMNAPKTAIHIGGFSRARGWPQLLQALKEMEHQELEVVCFGAVYEGTETLMAEAERLGVADRIHIRKPVPYEQIVDYLLCADVGLMLYQPHILNHVYAFPMKMYDYMLAGLPVIGPDFAVEVEPVIRQEECGLVVNTADPKQIADALDTLCDNPSLAQDMGRRGREAVKREYNWESQAKKLIDLYRGFATERDSAATN